jgi:tRNA pseudouridine38-40 synthase
LPRYKLTIEYAGSRYSGWQRQQNAKTVEGELQRAVREGLKTSRVETYGSGRTDAGVHALGQVAHLDLPAMVPPVTIVDRVNAALPHDINLLAAERVPARFHARHSAQARSYLYQISRRRTAFAKPFVWWVRDTLDVGAMRAAAAHVAGFADFRAFTDDDPDEKSTTVLVESLTIESRGSLLLVRVVGSHFLWKMVRRITGVLVEVGRGGLNASDVPALLAGSSGRPAELTAPASGLFLERVFYEGDRRDHPLVPVFNCPASPETDPAGH